MTTDGRLRVLLVGINYAPEPTGIARYSTGIARGLRERGHDVRVVTTYPHYPWWRVPEGYGGLSRREDDRGVDVRRLRHYVPARPQGVRRAASEISFGVHALARSWGRPDVVVCPSPALLATALVQLRSRRTAFGLQVQDLYSAGMAEQGGGAATGVIGRVEGAVARRADGVAVIHDRFKARLVADLGVPAERVSVIRNWTTLPPAPDLAPAEVRRRLGWAEHELVVLHTGAMGEKQGLGNVVDAARLVAARGLPVRFVLMGDGGQRPSLEAQAEGVPTVSFVDPLPDDLYVAALRAADVLLVNERSGIAEMAVPSKLTSYFSTGKPVVAAVAADGTTAGELAASGAGLVVAPDDPAALVDALEELRADPGRAARVGEAGPAYCARVLDEGAALDAYDAWVRRLVDHRLESPRTR